MQLPGEGHSRQREEQVQRPWSGSLPGLLEEKQEAKETEGGKSQESL